MTTQNRKIKRALISVSDKSGVVELARELQSLNIEIISTGGTAETLKQAGLNIRDVSEITNFPEMMDGRLKTLHPLIHGGLLAVRDNASHQAAQAQHSIEDIDLLVVNLYPFESTVKSGATFPVCIENIDIGGPAMIRAAAKNHDGVTVITSADDYKSLLDELGKTGGETTLEYRRKLAVKAFGRTATYDAAINDWLSEQIEDKTPKYRTLAGALQQALRYGENPHQWAAFYRSSEQRPGVATAVQIQGKELSYNNLNDTDAAYELVAEFDPDKTAGVAIIKHANPCGVACGSELSEAYLKALRCDPVSAFGGIVALNRELDTETAEEIIKIFTEVIIAPSASESAKSVIASKKNIRLLLAGELPDPGQSGLTSRTLSGGMLFQARDNGLVDTLELNVVTKRSPTEQELSDLKFAFKVCKHVKSNAIVYAKDNATVGIGAGQMSRIDSSRIASWKAEEAAKQAGLEQSLAIGSVVASDAFFPFSDGLLAASNAGATAVIQPGGSIRDEEVIAAADEQGLAMIFTGMRHFRH